MLDSMERRSIITLLSIILKLRDVYSDLGNNEQALEMLKVIFYISIRTIDIQPPSCCFFLNHTC